MTGRPTQALALLLLSACAPSGAGRAGDAAADSAGVRRALESYVSAARANNVAGMQAVWTDDGVYANAGIPTLRGRASIDSLIQAFYSTMQVKELSVDVEELAVSGDVAYLWGTYSETLAVSADSTQVFRGRYLWVMRRQSDGLWKIARAFGN